MCSCVWPTNTCMRRCEARTSMCSLLVDWPDLSADVLERTRTVMDRHCSGAVVTGVEIGDDTALEGLGTGATASHARGIQPGGVPGPRSAQVVCWIAFPLNEDVFHPHHEAIAERARRNRVVVDTGYTGMRFGEGRGVSRAGGTCVQRFPDSPGGSAAPLGGPHRPLKRRRPGRVQARFGARRPGPKGLPMLGGVRGRLLVPSGDPRQVLRTMSSCRLNVRT